jgi:hypothetical protein
MKYLLNIISISFLFTNYSAANDSIILQYAPPMDIPLLMSGNFGDARNSSFHFGIDFRTQEKTGWPVYSIADGYVARIKVEPGGYGKAIYIKHINGTMSVYAHLTRFNDSINKYVKEKQYDSKSFYQDIAIPENMFLIKQCDIIGFTGNSGQSSGPHLHFEIRDDKSQNPMNCLVSSFPIVDTLPPVIKKIWIYDNFNYLDTNGLYKKPYKVVKKDGTYQLNPNNIIKVPSSFFMGIEAYDYITDFERKALFFSSKLFLDSNLIFNAQFDEMRFDQTGSVNAFIDYKHKILTKDNIYHQFLYPNQELLAVKYASNKGLMLLNDSLVHNISIVITDISGNKTEANFKLQLQDSVLDNCIVNNTVNFLNYTEENRIENEIAFAVFPAMCLFTDVCIDFKKIELKNILLSDAIIIGDKSIPIKKPYSLFFPVSGYNDSLKNKLVIVNIDEYGDKNSIGGEIKGNKLVATTKMFGIYGVDIDTIPPKIIALNIFHKKNMKAEKCIKLKITDELSGINEYKCFIDNKWALFEYDLKSNSLTYNFDNIQNAPHGEKHRLKIIVSDKRNNKSTLSLSFIK